LTGGLLRQHCYIATTLLQRVLLLRLRRIHFIAPHRIATTATLL